MRGRGLRGILWKSGGGVADVVVALRRGRRTRVEGHGLKTFLMMMMMMLKVVEVVVVVRF